MKVIDCDIHPVVDPKRMMDFLPPLWRARLESGNRGTGGLPYWNPNGVMRSDTVLEDGTKIEASPTALAREFFDKYQIEYGIFIPSDIHICLSPDADYGASLVRATNDVIVEDWLPVDERYRASILVSITDPDLAVQEIHRLGDHPQMVQVLMPSAAHLPLGHRFFHPIYAAAVEHDLPVAIHPGGEGAGIARSAVAAGLPSRYLEWHTVLSANYMAQLTSLVTEGVFQKFPPLKFLLIEGGVCWLPPLMWRLDKNWKALRVTAPWLDRPPSAIIREHVRLSTQPLEEPPNSKHFQMMLEMFDAENMLMFSSDYPHWDGDTPDFVARTFPEAMRAKVLAENARKVYGLPERQHA
jgi:predicted TIM-barrel fold metal-dependent hydrolase